MARARVRMSLIRKQTWLDGDRRVVGLFMIAGVALGWMLVNSYGFYYGIPVGTVIVLFGLWLGRKMYKADPYMFEILQRHTRYSKYYAATPNIKTVLPKVKDFT